MLCIFQGKMLLLKRLPHKPHGSTWGLPAGKVDSGEDINQAILREVFDETGIDLKENDIVMLPELWVRQGDSDFSYYSFSVILETEPSIALSETEHQEFRWVTPEGSLSLDLIEDLDACNRPFFDL